MSPNTGFSRFGIRTLLAIVLVIAAFLGGWVCHRQRVRTQLDMLQTIHVAIAETTDAIAAAQRDLESLHASAADTDAISAKRAAYEKRQVRLQQLLRELLTQGERLVNELSE